jgi:hypothetical protein
MPVFKGTEAELKKLNITFDRIFWPVCKSSSHWGWWEQCYGPATFKGCFRMKRETIPARELRAEEAATNKNIALIEAETPV